MVGVATVSVDLTANSAKFTSGLSRADAALNASGRKWEKTLSSMDSKLAAFGSAVGGVLAGISVVGTVSAIYDVNAEFQKLSASLKTVTGSSASAEAAMAMIRDFASETPYQLSQVTEAFIKLKSMGLDASLESMRAYGNTASAMGKPINQMIEAVADAATGEFERLKEFGIKASSEGNTVSFTFKGITTTVEKNAADIEKYLRRLGEVEFAGAMTEQMKTLGGQTSNLSDQFDALLTTIGEAGFNNAFSMVLIGLTEKIKSFTQAVQTARALSMRVDAVNFGVVSVAQQTPTANSVASDSVNSSVVSDAVKENDKLTDSINKQVSSLQFQSDQLSRTEREQEIYNELEKAGVAITSERGQRIAEAAGRLYDKKKALDDAKESLEKFKEAEKQALELEIEHEDARKRIISNITNETDGNTRLAAALQVSEAEYERVKAQLELINALRQAGVSYTDGEIAQYDELIAKQADSRKSLDRLKEKNESLKKLGADLGMTFSSAFEDAIIEAKSFSDILQSLAQDIARIFLRQTITAPLTSAASSFLSGAISSAFGGGSAAAIEPNFSGTGFYATGVKSAPPGFAWVGEEGPELISLRGGENIYPARLSAAMARSYNIGHFAKGAYDRSFLSAANIGGKSGSDVYIDARGAEKGVEEKIGRVMREVQMLRTEVPSIAVKSVKSANMRGSMA